MGIALLLLGIWAVHLNARFSPIYSEIVCQLGPPRVKGISFSGGLHIDIMTTTTCENPNPYSVELTSAHGGKVYMGSSMTPVASVTRIPTATLPANGKGTLHAAVTIKPTSDMFGSLLSIVTAGTVPIYMDNNMQLKVDVKLLFGKLAFSKTINKECGMNVKAHLLGDPEIGPMVCGSSFSELKLPPVDAQVQDGRLHLRADSVDPEELEQGEKAKNIAMGVLMGVGLGLGGVLLVCGSVSLCRRCSVKEVRTRQARDVDLPEATTIPSNKFGTTVGRDLEGGW